MLALIIVVLALQQTSATPPRDQQPTTAAPGGTWVIRGRVTDASTGEPLRGAAVGIRSVNDDAHHGGTLTDDEGRWAFEGLATGDYTLIHGKPGYIRVRGVRIYSPVHVSAQFPVRNLELVLLRGGIITGRLTDALGEPAVGAQVEAQRVVDDQAVWGPHQDTTDDRGEFRLHGLEPGDYVLIATPGPHQPFGIVPGGDASPVATYYPGVVASAMAERIVVVEQGAVSDLTFQLQSAKTYSVKGRVVTASRGVDRVFVGLREDAGQFRQTGGTSSAPAHPDGTFTLDGVLPGQYRLTANVRLDDGEEFGEVSVTVGAEDADVVVHTRKPTVVRGHVVARSAKLQDLGRIQVVAVPAAPASAYRGGERGVMREDGTFECTTFSTPFRISAYARGSALGWRVAEVRWKGERVGKDGISAGAEVVDGIEIVIVGATARLQGTVRSASGPLLEGTVVVVPAETGSGDGSMTFFRGVIMDGRFVTPRMPEGRYLVAAIAAGAPGALTQDVVSLVREQGESVEIAEGEVRTIALSTVLPLR